MITKREWKYGLTLGLASMIWIGLEFFIANELHMPQLGDYTGYVAVVIPATLMFLGVRALKREQKGSLKLMEAVRLGFFSGVFAGALSGTFLLLYLYLNPDVISGYLTYVAESMQEAGNDQAAIDEALADLTGLYSPPIQAGLMFVGTLTVTTLMSGIVGIALRTKTAKT